MNLLGLVLVKILCGLTMYVVVVVDAYFKEVLVKP